MNYTKRGSALEVLKWSILTMALCMMMSLSANAQNGVGLASSGSYKSGGVKAKRPTNSTSKIEGNHIKYSIQFIKHTLRPDNPEKIGGAEVKLYNLFKNITEIAIANGEGKVNLYLEPSTTYQITVNKQGYRSRFMKIDVKALDAIQTESTVIMLKEERAGMF